MIKWLGQKGKEWIWEICKEAWKEQRIPRDWENNLIIPIYKKGDQMQCDNSHMPSTNWKPYIRVLEKILRGYLEYKLEESQVVFTPDKYTNDNIFMVRNLTEEKLE